MGRFNLANDLTWAIVQNRHSLHIDVAAFRAMNEKAGKIKAAEASVLVMGKGGIQEAEPICLSSQNLGAAFMGVAPLCIADIVAKCASADDMAKL